MSEQVMCLLPLTNVCVNWSCAEHRVCHATDRCDGRTQTLPSSAAGISVMGGQRPHAQPACLAAPHHVNRRARYPGWC